MNKTPGLVAVVIVILAVLAMIAYMYFLHSKQDATHQTVPPGIAVPTGPGISQRPSEPTPDNEMPPAPPGGAKGVIYTVSENGGDQNDLAPRPADLSHSRHPARDAIKALIRVDGSPIPAGTTLRGVKVEDGLATVDFSREFQTNFHGSETQEAQTVNSLLRTLGQFPSIERVQILVEGKPIDALSQLVISDPLPVIRPDSPRLVQSVGGTTGG